jgi:hypothetical protein
MHNALRNRGHYACVTGPRDSACLVTKRGGGRRNKSLFLAATTVAPLIKARHPTILGGRIRNMILAISLVVLGTMQVRGLSPTNCLKLLNLRRRQPAPAHVFISICDHWEPQWGRPSRSIMHERVTRWAAEYPSSVAGLVDSRGRCPQHSFFYPQEEYEPGLLEPIARLCAAGFGEVQVHLHHDGDTADQLREKLLTFTSVLHERHGCLSRRDDGVIEYAFIHGNWALGNSRPDGRDCGVDGELRVLRETGCYADFTMPAAPDPCQTSTINSIYYANADGHAHMAHDCGVAATVGQRQPPGTLLLVQGPLGFDWRCRKWGLLPRLENADLTVARPPTLDRLRLWLSAGIGVRGNDQWIFVKLHTHGAQESNTEMLLGETMRQFHHSLAQYSQQQPGLQYYYVRASDMVALVHQAEQGLTEPQFDSGGAARAVGSAPTTVPAVG